MKAAATRSRKRQYILESKIKAGFCEGCEEITEKVFVGEWKPSDKPREADDLTGKPSGKGEAQSPERGGEGQAAVENRYWIRCASCHQVYLLEEWQIQIDRELNLEELRPSDCQLYTPHGIYAQGDALYHKALDEVGVVREKNATGSGAHVIIVEFLKSGRKQLLENVQSNQGNDSGADSLGNLLKMKLKR
ncbi:hypothetical protein INT08_00560 [Prosthecochloris sp. N3]|uniref:Uncharacterized protein n=1 Tax=Prosthecochloris ethylica TaxID=2743976 RepID=A0ABR9XP75_9CHLB|nr:hypothetical protein [Prosthecochloris ethylica]MBF0635672.1 hypothetical protein [Prosthecochloris ethylica]NUK46971.1 hypothetical protein [Prosthecochloris ethylica]RNA65901.1 hypothetical protein CR163_009690 [Prosthecochloris sp. ZM_2]